MPCRSRSRGRPRRAASTTRAAAPTAPTRAAREITQPIYFSLLIIAIPCMRVCALPSQAGRLFKPLPYTNTFVMLSSARLSITFAPAMRDVLVRGEVWHEAGHPLSRAIRSVYKPFVYGALRRP